MNVKKRNPFINTQHVTKEPEVTESGEIHMDPENSKSGNDIDVRGQRQTPFLGENRPTRGKSLEFIEISRQTDQENATINELPRFAGSFAASFRHIFSGETTSADKPKNS